MKHDQSLLLLTCAFMTGVGCSSGNKADLKPNIIFIMIDDLGWKDLGYMGSAYYETPHIDRLARGGMIFTQAYANAANSAPTRACLLTGQYTPRHGLYTVANSDRGKPADRRLVPTVNNELVSTDKIIIPEALRQAGYTTASIGKWHIGKTPVEHGFDTGFDRDSLGYNRSHFNSEGQYLADRLTDEAVRFIKENNPALTGRPFFLSLTHHAVHTPVQAKKDLVAKYAGKKGDDCHHNPVYAAMIQSVDESIDRINNTIRELGMSENTILVFFSDNGGHGTYTCQKPLRGGKGMFYEGGIRVPMFVYWPGTVRPGITCTVPVISTDFYPTFLDIAGLENSDDYLLDGKSILPLLKGKTSIERNTLFWHFPAYLEPYSGLMEDARDTLFRTRPVSVIRKGDWKLLMFHEEWILDGGREKVGNNNSVELYNLESDPGETDNQCNKEPAIRDELLDDLLKWIDETGAPVPSVLNKEFIAPGNF